MLLSWAGCVVDTGITSGSVADSLWLIVILNAGSKRNVNNRVTVESVD